MSKDFNLIQQLSKKDDNLYMSYYEKENEFKRLAVLYSIVAFLVAPIFVLIVKNSNLSAAYTYIGISFIVLFPLYILLCWFVKALRNKMIYFFIFHLFGVTLIGFVNLIEYNFRTIDFFSFFAIYASCIFVIQRRYPTIIYTIYVLGLLLYGFQFVERPSVSQTTTFTFFGLLGVSSMIVLLSRDKMIHSMEDYAVYLKKIMENSNIGYILLIPDDQGAFKVVDFNRDSQKLLGVDIEMNSELTELFMTHFSNRELAQIAQIRINKPFNKLLFIEEERTLDIDISLIELKTGTSWLCRITDITNRIKEKEELVQREEKYRNLYYKNQAGVFTLDKTTKLIDFNETFNSMFENSFKKGDNFVKEEYIDEWEELVELITNNHNLRNYQTHFKLRSGVVKWFVFNYFYDSKTGYIEGTVVDVTNVQRTSIALSQSEEKYRLIYEESNDAILLLDDDEIIDVNRRGIQLFGVSEDEMLTRQLWELSADQSKESEKNYKKFKKKLHLSKSTKFNWTFQGSNQIIEAEVAIVELNISDRMYYQCVIHDVTDKNATIRALEASKENFRAILDNNPEGMIIICENEFLYANKEAYHLLKTDELAIDNLFKESDQQVFEGLVKKQVEEDSKLQAQLNLLQADGNEVLVDVTMVSTRFAEKKSTLIIVKDISLQTKLSKEVLRAEIAEETNKRLEKEIANRNRAERELENLFLKTKAIYDSSLNTFLLTLDLNNCITSFNSHSDNYFFNLTRQHIKPGKHIADYFNVIFSQNELRYFELILHKVKLGFSRQVESKFMYKDQEFWLELFINPIFDTEGVISEISLVAHDITDKKISEKGIVDSLKEKEILLKEIHHRVKNNLQVISSILNLQSSFIQDKKMLDVLQESRNRIRSMAIIHEDLYRTANFASINFANYILNLATNLVSLYRMSEENVELKYELDEIDLVLDQAVPCGLLVNEIISNSIKYAFPENSKGVIFISLKEDDGQIELKVTDNGIGLPKDFVIENSDTLGLQLVLTLVDQLDGQIEIDGTNGTEILIKFGKTKL